MSRYKERSRKIARELYWEEHNRDTYQCPDCARVESEVHGHFEVHHKNGEPMDNRPENHIALCRLCHNLREGKKPSLENIRKIQEVIKDNRADEEPAEVSPSMNRVYAAGAMHYNGDDSTWRSQITLEDNHPDLEVINPKEIHFDHGGDLVSGVVSADMDLLNHCDGVVAYFDKKEQVGTMVELLHAISKGIPALVLFSKSLVGGVELETKPDIDQLAIPFTFIDNPVNMRFESPVYWFLINYIVGDSNRGVDSNYTTWGGVKSDVKIAVVDSEDAVSRVFAEWHGRRQLQGLGWV